MLQFQFFKISINDAGVASETLNRFLRAHRVLNVSKEFTVLNDEAFWAICVEHYKDDTVSSVADSKRKRVDYRELLTEEEFELFNQLREWRKMIAEKEGVPVYAIFTNEQLASITREKITTATDLTKTGNYLRPRD